jgi:hypothetical protein
MYVGVVGNWLGCCRHMLPLQRGLAHCSSPHRLDYIHRSRHSSAAPSGRPKSSVELQPARLWYGPAVTGLHRLAAHASASIDTLLVDDHFETPNDTVALQFRPTLSHTPQPL